MTDKTKLRQQAEAQLALTPEILAALSPEETQKRLHELSVHQIELEMQNEELRRAQVDLDASRARYFDLYDLAPVGYCSLSEAGLVLESNLTATNLLGLARRALVQQPFSRFIFKDDQSAYYLHRKQLLASGPPQAFDLRMVKPDGTVFWAQLTAATVPDAAGAPVCRIAFSDISKGKLDEEKLRQSEFRSDQKSAMLQSILASPQGIVIFSLDCSYRYTVFTPAHQGTIKKIWGADIAVGMNMLDVIADPADRAKAKGNFDRALRGEHLIVLEEYGDAGRARNYYENHYNPIFGADGSVSGLTVFVIDVTARKRAETEKDELENQLRQAQKMESVGRLAGGVAHDFNNMLSIILGRTEMAIEQLGAAHPLRADLEEVRMAAGRSADLTRQLLAFARKQTVAPKVQDLNETVEHMLQMLRRLIGENIDLRWQPKTDLWPVKMDPAQIDQILANLCVNARDAIAGVGRITIETGNAVFDAADSAGHPGVSPGEYVLLSVGDTGGGMDRETLAHIFEPFFTTKGVGEGTGLGLATIYGAVKQNNGFITVDSQPGRGTIFRIFLPRHPGKERQRTASGVPSASARGDETILLVEDEPAILNMIGAMLGGLGYAVVAASTPGAAIRMAQEHPGGIQLLMTDVVMPEMNGRDLAKNLLALYPDLKRLFMSGYTADVIAHQGILDAGVHFIQKPFTMHLLAAKIREALGP